MSSKWRRFEVLLPLKFNDGREVPPDWLVEAVWEVVGHFGAASYETQKVAGAVRFFPSLPSGAWEREVMRRRAATPRIHSATYVAGPAGSRPVGPPTPNLAALPALGKATAFSDCTYVRISRLPRVAALVAVLTPWQS
jgi:hypothetical protein